MFRLLFIGFFSIVWFSAQAQDPFFSQFFSNPIYLNPAFAGYDGCPTIRTSYRNQWPETSRNFQTSNISYDMMLGKRHGLAVNYQYDNAAHLILSHNLSVVYAPVFRVFNKQLAISPAMEITWKYRKLETDAETWGEIVEPRYGSFNESYYAFIQNKEKHLMDFIMGILLTFKGLVYGAAFHHISQPDISFAGIGKLPVKITSHINYTIKVTDKFGLAPSLIFTHQQDYTQFLPSIAFSVFGAKAGLAYRVAFNNPDDLIFQFGYQGKGFKVGYSFDFGVSPFTNNESSHEVALGYVFNCQKKEYKKGVSQIAF